MSMRMKKRATRAARTHNPDFMTALSDGGRSGRPRTGQEP
jgi:hypothetical protein